jgi:DNA repair exonuclease SbcCD ATPase subunit
MSEPIIYFWIGALQSISGPVIYFWIGALVAVLIVFSIKPLVRSRLGHRAMQRLETSAPTLMADIEADMDQLHSQIAVATRRLEMSVEQMKSKTTNQLAEIGRSSEAIGRLKGELAERSAAFALLQEKELALGSQLYSTEAELAAKTKALNEVERTLAERKAELARFMAEFNVHPEITKIQHLHAMELENAKADKALVDEQLRQSKEESLKLQYEIDAISKQVESTWASERMANAVLRERINDVASEVVRVATALEGLSSPIDSLVAAKAVTEQAEAAAATNGGGGGENENGNGHGPYSAIEDGSESAKATLVHRIRALRKRTPQLPAPG